MSTWSSARETLGQGTPQDGSTFDRSSDLRQAQSGVNAAAPGSRWTGSAADAYGAANTKQSQMLGQMAVLDQRLGAEVDRSAAVITAGRQNLASVKQWVTAAASSVPEGADRKQMLTQIARKGLGDVSDVVRQTNNDLNGVGKRIQTIGNEYQKLGDGKNGNAPKDESPRIQPLGNGKDGTDSKTQNVFGGGKFGEFGGYKLPDGTSPPGNYAFPFSPNIPPPKDTLPGGGRWNVGGEGYPSGPNGGPPTQPPEKGKPFDADWNPPVEGRGSGFETIGTVPPNGWGEDPIIKGQESYRFRFVGESFNPDAPGHVQWVQQDDGKWYRAEWIDYKYEQNRLLLIGDPGRTPPPIGLNQWKPVSIQDIYNIHNSNPKINIHLPDLCGQEFTIPPRP